MWGVQKQRGSRWAWLRAKGDEDDLHPSDRGAILAWGSAEEAEMMARSEARFRGGTYRVMRLD